MKYIFTIFVLSLVAVRASNLSQLQYLLEQAIQDPKKVESLTDDYRKTRVINNVTCAASEDGYIAAIIGGLYKAHQRCSAAKNAADREVSTTEIKECVEYTAYPYFALVLVKTTLATADKCQSLLQ